MEKLAVENIVPIWRYAPVYDRIMREGHLYPAPNCGSPSLIWHIGLAPKRRFGDKPGLHEPWLDQQRKTDWQTYLNEAHNAYDEDFKSFIDELNVLASRLQQRRLAKDELFEVQRLKASRSEEPHTIEGAHQFKTAVPQTLSFILWWPDREATEDIVSKETGRRFLRVQIQIQVHTGYATISFIIDASKPYGEPQIETSPEEDTSLTDFEQANATKILDDPFRRGRIRRALNIIRCSSLKQIKTRAVGKSRLPESEVEEAEAKDLKDAADYIYKGVWDEFVSDFDLKLLSSAEEKQHDVLGERFADFRGHIMSVAGLRTDELVQIQKESEKLQEENVLPVDEEDNDERNTEDSYSNESEELIKEKVPQVGKAEKDNPDAEDTYSLEASRYTIPKWRPGYGFNLLNEEKPSSISESGGHAGFGRFHTFDSKRNEAHTVLRSLWPFLRRFSPWADYRELVGCGVMGWRALYVSTLGFGGQKYAHIDEVPSREKDVPADHLSDLEEILGQESSFGDAERFKKLVEQREASRPVRFLIVTKGEPHREQLGRLIERITALETGRLFALRDITMIRNAGTHIEIIGRMLDGLLENWSKKREIVESKYVNERNKLKEKYSKNNTSPDTGDISSIRDIINEILHDDNASNFSFLSLKKHKRHNILMRVQSDWTEIEEQYIDDITKLIKSTDRHAIRLAATLEGKIGSGGAGRVMHAINRAQLSIQEFEYLIPTLDVGDIDGWTSYPQFITRGVKPSFDFIRTTGERLFSTRDRLQAITETVQTAALISETEATRLNTQAIREVARHFAQMRTAGIVGVALLFLIAVLRSI